MMTSQYILRTERMVLVPRTQQDRRWREGCLQRRSAQRGRGQDAKYPDGNTGSAWFGYSIVHIWRAGYLRPGLGRWLLQWWSTSRRIWLAARYFVIWWSYRSTNCARLLHVFYRRRIFTWRRALYIIPTPSSNAWRQRGDEKNVVERSAPVS